MGRIARALDLPPVWLAGFVALAWGFDRIFSGLGFGWAWSRWLGAALIVIGLAAMTVALREFLREKTTFVPRRAPSAFVRGGVYRFTRNPIYLGDALMLAGFVLWWDVLPALLLVPVFMGVITRRFILGEEAGLRAAFGEEFEAWAARVRRWL